MNTRLVIDDERVQRMFRGVQVSAKEIGPAWKKWKQYMRVVTDHTFRALRHGGRYRGVRWKYFANQYTRKDGTIVPAWGGVPRVRPGWHPDGRRHKRTTGNVSGRLRPSGQRVKRGDAVGQDTATMRKRALTTIRQTSEVLELGPRGVRYAAYQQRGRPFLFFQVPRDSRKLVDIFVDHLHEGAQKGRAS